MFTPEETTVLTGECASPRLGYTIIAHLTTLWTATESSRALLGQMLEGGPNSFYNDLLKAMETSIRTALISDTGQLTVRTMEGLRNKLSESQVTFMDQNDAVFRAHPGSRDVFESGYQAITLHLESSLLELAQQRVYHAGWMH